MATSATRRRVKPVNKWLVVRRSRVHGKGCFARCFIPKGTRIIEYLGDRISHKEADQRYEGADVNDNHTFLFIADRRTVIDATRGGSDARWINHSCDGNCESEIEKSRVFIEARRDIAKGDELGYDYQIGRDPDDPADVDTIYACRCGSPKCRGTMLWPAKRRKARARPVARRRATATQGRRTKKKGKRATKGKRRA
jgi:SET domain-containing protein